ncbi:hypothetical protein Ancab_039112 [Ancistrocladus abbreviatus]
MEVDEELLGMRASEPASSEQQRQDESFVWDEPSQLYYHARSGFYHDPIAGWYYSSKDNLYYKFEDGNYVLLDSYKSDVYSCGEPKNPRVDESYIQECSQDNAHSPSLQENENQPDHMGPPHCSNNEAPENPPPTSEWLEDTLIDLYLSGYSDAALSAVEDVKPPLETDENDNSLFSVDGNDHNHEREEAASLDEENWQAQYGQVIREDEGSIPDLPVVDLWDWAIITENKGDGTSQVAKLVGRLVQPSTKLHPSMPSSGIRLRTAPICEVLLDLVRVRSGQVYKLRSPSAGYLATLSSYDSSNPTKDWGFPELSVAKQSLLLSELCESREFKRAPLVPPLKDASFLHDQFSESEKRKNVYRDRAAERRAFHGGFGVGPGQKKSIADAGPPFSPVSGFAEEGTAEALNMSFGAGSYARRMLEIMGWKEGEGLGKAKQGLTKPLEAVGNKGNAGLGWNGDR